VDYEFTASADELPRTNKGRVVIPIATRRSLLAFFSLLGSILLSVGCSAETAATRSTDQLTVSDTGSLPSSCVGALARSRLLGPRPTSPRALSTSLQAGILSRFALFRRDAQESDEPLIQADSLASELAKDYELSSYYPGYVRQLGRHAGDRYFVIPGFGRPEALPPAHCRPAALRRELVEQRRRRLSEVVYCVIETGGGDSHSPGCEPFAEIHEGRPIFESGVAIVSREPVVGLVPDGLASLRIAYRETAPIVVRVSSNAFLFASPSPSARVQAKLSQLEHEDHKRLSTTQQLSWTLRWNRTVAEAEPTKVEWLDSSGGLIRLIHPPAAQNSSSTSVGNLRAPIEG
jgi:hypothetical protein